MQGRLDLEGESTVLGIALAQQLQIRVGDKLTVYSPGNLGQILDGIKKLENTKGEAERKAVDELRDVVLPKELTVTGIFETGHYSHDSEFLLVPLYVGQELYGLGDTLQGITVKTDDPYSAARVKARDRAVPHAAGVREDLDRDESPIFRSGPARAHGDVLPPVLYRRGGGVRNHEHADHGHRAEAARDRNHEGAGRDQSGKSSGSFLARELWSVSLERSPDSGWA